MCDDCNHFAGGEDWRRLKYYCCPKFDCDQSGVSLSTKWSFWSGAQKRPFSVLGKSTEFSSSWEWDTSDHDQDIDLIYVNLDLFNLKCNRCSFIKGFSKIYFRGYFLRPVPWIYPLCIFNVCHVFCILSLVDLRRLWRAFLLFFSLNNDLTLQSQHLDSTVSVLSFLLSRHYIYIIRFTRPVGVTRFMSVLF